MSILIQFLRKAKKQIKERKKVKDFIFEKKKSIEANNYEKNLHQGGGCILCLCGQAHDAHLNAFLSFGGKIMEKASFTLRDMKKRSAH